MHNVKHVGLFAFTDSLSKDDSEQSEDEERIPKRAKKRIKKENSFIEYLTQKNSSELEWKKDQLDFEREKLRLEREKFDLDKQERMAKLEQERKEKIIGQIENKM